MADEFWSGLAGGVHPAVRAWFEETLGEPTEPQLLGWPVIARGDNALILAPTGSGKTLAAFLMAINDLCMRAARGEDLARVEGPQVLYVSPLKALNNDIHRNLELPLVGITAAATRMGHRLPVLRSVVRTGDTPSDERRLMLREPPHILITTPESLFLMLCSNARSLLRHVRTVIVDEIHALFANKRGTQLALALEYLQEIVPFAQQRIGLSATQRPLEDIAAYLGGGLLAPSAGSDAREGPGWSPRPVEIIQAPGRKQLDVQISLPVSDFADLPENTVWPEIFREVYELATQHRTTLVFVNNRQVGERVAAALNDLAGEDFSRVHHGSISREVRQATERALKAGELRCLVATSTLELGIDIGQIDLVVQVESPREVSRGLQRVGRAGHVPGKPSKGRIIPKTRQDLLEAAVIAERMRSGWIEPQSAQLNALDVLTQFVTGLAIERPRRADEIYAVVRRAYNYRGLGRREFESVLGMASGHFDTGEYLELRPLVYWDRTTGAVSVSERGKRLVYTSGGTIPDRGEYAVYLQGQGVRLGQLDEEFVYERRIGDRFSLGTSAWRITQIQHDRVVVVPSTGGPRVPFWKGEMYGRPYLLGKALGEFMADAEAALCREAHNSPASGADPFWEDWARRAGLDSTTTDALRSYLRSQQRATGALPSTEHLVIEEFRDELGQWRVIVHSPYGRRVNDPLALLLEDSLTARGHNLDLVVTDDAILFGGTTSESPPPVDPVAIQGTGLTGRLAVLVRKTVMFGRLFREAAGRALILPRLQFGRKRTPHWLSRRKSASLLQVVERLPGFPLVQEALREALASVYDLDGLGEVVSGLATGAIKVIRVRRNGASPFARPPLFAAMGAFLYGDDLPPAERRLRFLGLDHQALSDLLGRAHLRDMLDPAAIDEATWRARPASLAGGPPESAEELHDWLVRRGELPVADAPEAIAPLLAELEAAGRVLRLSWRGEFSPGSVWVAAEHLPDYEALFAEQRQAPEAADAPPVQALVPLVRRFAMRAGPFTLDQVTGYLGLDRARALRLLNALTGQGLLRRGEFRPGGSGDDWVDPALLVEMHRRSLALARRQVQPVAPEDYAAFLQDWQGLSGKEGRRSGPEGLAQTLEQLQGLALPAEDWEAAALPLRVADYSPHLLDAALGSGLFRWVGSGKPERLRVAFWAADALGTGGPESSPDSAEGAGGGLSQPAGRVHEVLTSQGAQFIAGLWRVSGLPPGEVLAALEQLMARGLVTNDTFGPIRYLLSLGPEYRSLPRTLTNQVLSGMARWSTVAAPTPDSDELARQLLKRYGLVCREVASAEEVPWSDLLSSLSRMEILGTVRRGYYVRGLSGMQFALPDAVERLRAVAEWADQAGSAPPPIALGDGDPAWAWGRILPWPEHLPSRPRPPAALVTANGSPVLACEGRPLRLVKLADLPLETLLPALRCLTDAAQRSIGGRLEVAAFDGQPVRETPVAALLEQLGFTAAPLTMVRYSRP